MRDQDVAIEWRVEYFESNDHGDIQDVSFGGSLEECMREVGGDVDKNVLAVVVLTWVGDRFNRRAYLDDGKLPTHFSDAYGQPEEEVPARYHREVESYFSTRPVQSVDHPEKGKVSDE